MAPTVTAIWSLFEWSQCTGYSCRNILAYKLVDLEVTMTYLSNLPKLAFATLILEDSPAILTSGSYNLPRI